MCVVGRRTMGVVCRIWKVFKGARIGHIDGSIGQPVAFGVCLPRGVFQNEFRKVWNLGVRFPRDHVAAMITVCRIWESIGRTRIAPCGPDDHLRVSVAGIFFGASVFQN